MQKREKLVDDLKKCFKNLEICPFYPIEEEIKKVFVQMPLKESFNEIYQIGIKNGLAEIGWDCERSDERWDTLEIVCTICKSIQEASLIIADVTGKNANVFLELGLSFGLEKNILLITQDFSDLPFDIRTFRVIEYDSENLRKLQGRLQEWLITGRLIVAETSEEAIAFHEDAKRYSNVFLKIPHRHTLGSIVEGTIEPMMQILIGSKNSRDRWLEPSEENRRMFSCAPEFLRINETICRENFYEFISYNNKKFLRVFPDGFIVSHFPCVEESTASIHELMWYISGMFFFANRIMKRKNVKQPQRIRMEIHGMLGMPIQLDWRGPLMKPRKYKFGETPIILEEDFNPANNWKDLFQILISTYRKICSHLGIQTINETTIRKNLCELLMKMSELKTYYPDSEISIVPWDDIFS